MRNRQGDNVRKLLFIILLFITIFLIGGCKTGGIVTPGGGTGPVLTTRKFHIKWYFKINWFKNLYIPIPIDSEFQSSTEHVTLSPQPDKIHEDPDYKNKIGYYKEHTTSMDFSMIFNITLTKGSQYVNPDNIKPYDTTSDIYKTYTDSNSEIQTGNNELISLAGLIVADEVNPYKKAKYIYEYIRENIGEPTSFALPDAVSVYVSKEGDCVGKANLFVALCRIENIPARIVSGISDIKEGVWVVDEMHNKKEYDICVWAEFYLPEYGWIFVDPEKDDSFANIPDYRISLSKGADIDIDPSGSIYAPWFNMPMVSDWQGGNYTPIQISGKYPLSLLVTEIQ